jgi:hypothetical protein
MNVNRLAATRPNEWNRVEVEARSTWVAAAGLGGWMPALWQQQLYRAAYERAVALHAPWPPPALAVPCLN